MLGFVDLYCGGGFGARGAVNGGGTPLLAVDFWDIATATYKANFPNAEVITGAVEDPDVLKKASFYKPDVLMTSPEFTSHSIARGAKPGCEKSKETAINIVPWVRALNPRWLIVENVNRMKQWGRHEELVRTIENQGYTVSDLLLNAADFGAAQSRKRMFLICDRQGHRVTRDELLAVKPRRKKTARDIIDWSDKYKSGPLYTERRAPATIERAKRAINAIGSGKPFIIVYYGSDYAGGWQSVDAPLRTITTLDRFALVTWRGDTPFMRMLQPSELQKAMSGGNKHKIDIGSRRERVKVCGNGVCSPVTEAIFHRLNQLQLNQMS